MIETILDEIIQDLKKTIPCNCNLDKWEPEKSTGHSWVCGIHKEALRIAEYRKRGTRP